MIRHLSRHRLLVLILALTVGAYSLSLGNGFVNLDDNILVTENPHVLHPSFAHILYVFTHFDPELYVPLTLLSYQAETWVLGLAAWHFHLVNLLLHLGSVLLAYSLLLALTKSRKIALVAAALFALHPVNAEAVLWVSGRKDLLAGFFVLATLRSYLIYKEGGERKWFIACLLLTLAALLSKISAVTLPLVLLLLVYVRENNISKKTVRELLPFFVLAFVLGMVALLGKSEIDRTASDLLLMSFRTTWFTLRMFFLPFDLSVVHRIDAIGLLEPGFLSAIIVLLGLSLLFWKLRPSLPLAWAGWLFFLLTLAPSWVQYEHGNQLLYEGSERYAYLPSIGLALIIGSFVFSPFFVARLSKINRYIFILIFCVLLLLFTGMILHRSLDWRDSITFNESILKHDSDDPIAHHNLALALAEDGHVSDAEMHYRKAIEGKPTFFDAYTNLGSLLVENGRVDEGLVLLKQATHIKPDSFRGFFNLGVAYQKMQRWTEAADAYEQSIEREPRYTESHRNLGLVYGKLGRFEDGLREYAILAELDPAFAETLRLLQEQMKK